jgi:hypothetical protein
MGKAGLRYAAKVDLNKPAADQDVLHVRNPTAIVTLRTLSKVYTD